MEMTHTAARRRGRSTRRNSSQAPGGIGEEHEAELTDHGVEGAVGEWQRLTIRRYGPESAHRPTCVIAASSIANEMSAPTTSPEGPTWASAIDAASPGPVATSRMSVSRGDLGSSQHSWHEEARPIPDVAVVRGAVDMLSNCRVKSRSEVHAHWRLTVFWCSHTPFRAVRLEYNDVVRSPHGYQAVRVTKILPDPSVYLEHLDIMTSDR